MTRKTIYKLEVGDEVTFIDMIYIICFLVNKPNLRRIDFTYDSLSRAD